MPDFSIRKIQPSDDPQIKSIIESVGQEFGAIGEGFGPSDAEVSAMSMNYNASHGSVYYVAETSGQIKGGGGIAPLAFSKDVCELKKLFLLPEARGYGIGKKLTVACLKEAQSFGFKQCYLDTLASMEGAINLYLKLGFKLMDEPHPLSIHSGCDVWMLKELGN